jgi:hypothetical protein
LEWFRGLAKKAAPRAATSIRRIIKRLNKRFKSGNSACRVGMQCALVTCDCDAENGPSFVACIIVEAVFIIFSYES